MLKASVGNAKIGRDTLIINMQSATDCTSKKMGLCKHCGICYAMKAERQYPSVLPYRRGQEAAWKTKTAEELAADILSQKTRNVKFLRFSEAGDFSGQGDVVKLSKIADIMKEAGIMVYGYTARKDLDFSGVSDNMTINGSGFMVHNEFKAVKAASGNVCGGDCRTCGKCKTRTGKSIQVQYH